MQVAAKFSEKWQFPHCLGAMDGKHVVIQSPIHSGTEYYNYKSFFSIVMFALVDADYNFLFLDAGCQGRISDGGIFKDTELFKKMQTCTLNIPEQRELPGREKPLPYVIIGDSAFPLTTNIMKPYSGIHPKGTFQRIFNYRLSRARRVVENVFGITSQVFRVLRKPMLLQPKKAETIVMAIAHLHNYLKIGTNSGNLYISPHELDYEEDGVLHQGSWRNDPEPLTSLLPLRNVPRRVVPTVKEIRDEFADYFVKEGNVSWQLDYA